MTQILLSAVAGVLAWFATSFFGAPFKQFLELRQRIATERLRALNTPINLLTKLGYEKTEEMQKDIDRLEEVKDRLRDAAISMQAFGQSMPVTRVLRWFGFDPALIADRANAYANDLDGPILRRAQHDRELRSALKIKG